MKLIINSYFFTVHDCYLFIFYQYNYYWYLLHLKVIKLLNEEKLNLLNC